MTLITKSELFYNDYLWTTYSNDNPKITGEPDSTLLNRKEGYEILYFINKLSEIHKLKAKSSVVKIEKMIRNEVPTILHSQENIKKWIENNWEESKF
ncbi:MAG: hypothetical protein RIQ59_255 [Bacteroidota bacterium]|jgi:hypothetical protein